MVISKPLFISNIRIDPKSFELVKPNQSAEFIVLFDARSPGDGDAEGIIQFAVSNSGMELESSAPTVKVRVVEP